MDIIGRQRSAFLLWARNYRPNIAQTYTHPNSIRILSKLGPMWNGLSEDEKKRYYDEFDAQNIKGQHRMDHPSKSSDLCLQLLLEQFKSISY
jgi:hypothetical protein